MFKIQKLLVASQAHDQHTYLIVNPLYHIRDHIGDYLLNKCADRELERPPGVLEFWKFWSLIDPEFQKLSAAFGAHDCV